MTSVVTGPATNRTGPIFALEVVLCELHTGSHPFTRRSLFDSYDVIMQSRFSPPRTPTDNWRDLVADVGWLRKVRRPGSEVGW